MAIQHLHKALNAITGYRTRERKRLGYEFAVLGNNQGIVEIPGETGIIWVQLHGDPNQVVRALASVSTPCENVDAGVVVKVEKIKQYAGARYKVVGFAAELNPGDDRSVLLGRHGDQHEYRDFNGGGGDPVNIHPDAILPLRAQPNAPADMTLRVLWGVYQKPDGSQGIYNGGISPAFVPVIGATRRCDLLYLASDGTTLTILQGTPTLDGSIPPRPTTPTNCTPLAWVYLDSTVSAIASFANILSARELVASALNPGGSGGHVIQDEGTPLTARANLNFVGAGVTATDDAGNNATVVTIPGGGGVGALTDSHIFVGNASNVATDVPLSGDAAMANTGALSLLGVAAGHIVYVPLAGDIQTYVNAANAGDTLILASGEYIITDTITINKQLNIRGQGSAGFLTAPVTFGHGTLISCVDDSVTALQIDSSNVRISDLSINMQGDTATGISVGTNAAHTNLIGVVLFNVDVVLRGTGWQQGFIFANTDVIARGLTFVIQSLDSGCSGFWFLNNSNANKDSVADCFSVTGTTQGASTFANSFLCNNLNSAHFVTLNLSNSVCKALAGTALDVAVGVQSTTTNNAICNCYMCTLDGQDYDAYQTGTNQLNIGGSVLVSNRVFGTVTYRAAMAAEIGIFSTSLSTPKITNLTSNGFVKTSGGDGTLSVDATAGTIHAPVTVTDTASIDLTLTGQDIKGDVIFGTSATTATVGNDARLSDKRNPVDAIHDCGNFVANLDNYNPGADYQVYLIRNTSGGTLEITGLARGSATNNRVKIIAYNSNGMFKIKHQSASSLAANRIITPDTNDVLLQGDASFSNPIDLEYDTVYSRWRVVVAVPLPHALSHLGGASDQISNSNTTAAGLLLRAVAPGVGLTNVPAIENGETVWKIKQLFPNNAAGVLTNNGTGTITWAAAASGGGSSWLMNQVFS
jgi:hypothetical protein